MPQARHLGVAMISAQPSGRRANKGADQKRDRGDNREVGGDFPRLGERSSRRCGVGGGCALGRDNPRARAEREQCRVVASDGSQSA